MTNRSDTFSLRDIVTVHTIQLIEQAGPLEDSEAMNHAFRSASGREARLVERARVLAKRFHLQAEIERWHDMAPYVWLGLSVLVFFIAYGIAAAVIGGERSINAVLAFFIALGMHAITLVLWLIAVGASAWTGRSTLARMSLGGLFLRLVAWLPFDRGPHSLTLLRATNSTLQRAKLLPWALGFISHTIWTLAFALVLLALWFAFSFQQYRLTWETTILSADFFVSFVQITGWLPHLLGFPLPDTSTLLNPAAPSSNHSAWAWWLIGCTLVYGLIPRVILAVLSQTVWQRGTRSLRLDTADPYFRKLLTRFDEMEVPMVVDPEQRPDADATLRSVAPPPGDHTSLAIVGFELPPEYPWPPADLARPAQFIERISGTSQERRVLLNALAQARPYRILLVCNPVSSPDRGTERFIREACAYGAHCALLLAPPARDEAGNPARWRSWLDHIGLNTIQTFEDNAIATEWFKPAHA